MDKEKCLICPKCSVEMRAIKVRQDQIDECPECGGIWIDNEEEKIVLEMSVAVFTIDDIQNFRKYFKPLEKREKVKYFKCPRCGDFMWRKNYMKFSGIIVDKCAKHGTFFDKGELEKAVEFVKKGGIEFAKMKLSQSGINELNRKIDHEISNVRTDMYFLYNWGRFLKRIGI